MTLHAASDRAPPRILVAGLGNLDRGDDGLGADVVALLAGRMPQDVELLTRRGDMLALIEEWAGVDVCIAIDAAAPAGDPGRIFRFDLATDTLPADAAYMSSHAMGLPAVVALARALGRAPRDMIVYAVEGICFDDGAPLSRPVAQAARDVADRIVAEVERLCRADREATIHA